MLPLRRCDFALCRCIYPTDHPRSQYCWNSCRAKDNLRQKGKAYQGTPLTDEQADRLSIQLNKQARWKLTFQNPKLLAHICQQQEQINQMRSRLDDLVRQEKQAWEVCYPDWSTYCKLVLFPKKAEGLSSKTIEEEVAQIRQSKTATRFDKALGEAADAMNSFVEQFTRHQKEEARQDEQQELAGRLRPLLTTAIGLFEQRRKLHEQLLEKYLDLQKQVRELNREEPRKRIKKEKQPPASAAPSVITAQPVALVAVPGKYRSAIEIMQQPGGERIELDGPLGSFLGKLERQCLSVTLTGKPGGGKSHFCFILARAFCDKGLKVMFYSLEEGSRSEVFKDKMIRYGLSQEPLFHAEESATLEEIKEAATYFDVIILDSWTMLPNVKGKAFGELSKQFPRLVFISIFQLTSGDKIRGGTQPIFDAFINLKVIDGIVYNTKNRYGGTGEFDIFNH